MKAKKANKKGRKVRRSQHISTVEIPIRHVRSWEEAVGPIYELQEDGFLGGRLALGFKQIAKSCFKKMIEWGEAGVQKTA